MKKGICRNSRSTSSFLQTVTVTSKMNEPVNCSSATWSMMSVITGFVDLFLIIAWTVFCFMTVTFTHGWTQVRKSELDQLSVRNSSRATVTSMKTVCKMRWMWQLCSEAWCLWMFLQRLFNMYKRQRWI